MNNEAKAEEITNYFISYLCDGKKVPEKQYAEYKKEVLIMLEND